MKTIKKYLNVDGKYKFEWNDLRALLQLVNVLLIIVVNVQTGSIFGLTISTLGLIKDLTDKNRRINSIILHLLGMVLNAFFLWFL
ncbi:MAG: hypothetical protein LIR50_11880 [Bacillota bacterium]|jgi:hypothetical protein|nr:hypothetical protein [Bacillota bacterium]